MLIKFKEELKKNIKYCDRIFYKELDFPKETVIVDSINIPNKVNRRWAIEEAVGILAESVYRTIYLTIDKNFKISQLGFNIDGDEIIVALNIKYT